MNLSNTKKILTLLLFFAIATATAQNQSKINEKTFNNRVRLNYMAIDMPVNDRFSEKQMGLGGLHYQIPINDFFYAGAGMYFALHGDQGGLFTLGAEVGINTPIYKNIYLDANLHFGGGGGYRTLINDGSYINPNIGLEFKKKDYAFGIQYSYFDFLSGDVRDDAVSVYIQIPNQVNTTSYKNANQIITAKNLENKFNRKSSKSALVVRFDFFNPINKSKRDIGTPLKNQLYVLGFEYQKYINNNLFLYVHTDAIYKGLRAGFMDLFVGGGFHPTKTKYIDFTTKLGIGSAGGRIFPEGGATIYPSIGLDLKPIKDLTISTHLGYLKALDGDFEANTYGFGLKYNIESGGTTSFNGKEKKSEFKTQGLRVSLQNQTYLNVPKTDDIEGKLTADLQLIGLNINYDFNNYFYGIGEAGFAYKERSGGYAHGLIGLGGKSPNFFSNKARVHLEIVGGVAGGGGINTKEGIVFRPTIGLSYDLNDQFSVYSSAGKFLSLDRKVNSTNFNIGISFNFASLKARK